MFRDTVDMGVLREGNVERKGLRAYESDEMSSGKDTQTRFLTLWL